jgi:hypothetical protein
VSSITIVSDDATIWSITYDHHYDDRNCFIIQATVSHPPSQEDAYAFAQIKVCLQVYKNGCLRV